MARSLGIETVAEGIETLEQQTYLRNRSCDLGQGFLYAKPMDPSAIASVMSKLGVGDEPMSAIENAS